MRSNSSAGSFGIVPAAGQSFRMEEENKRLPHKLLLPWNDATVMDQVLRAWTESSATRVIVIVRKDNTELQQVCRQWPSVDLVIPEYDPEDMKRSVQFGLQHIAVHYEPRELDRWLMAPADLPTMTSSVINRLIEAGQDSDSIVSPRFGDRPGHPVSFPWSLVPRVFELGADQGINSLLESIPVRWLEMPADEYARDMDTPADYASLSKKRERA